MKTAYIEIEKSKTLDTSSAPGKVLYRKGRMAQRVELEDGDDYKECEEVVTQRIETYFEEEKKRMIEEMVEISNNKASL